MFGKFKSTKKQGDAGLGIAIAWFTLNGWTVSIPLSDSQEYDLVVDQSGFLKKVQVKTTSQKSHYGSCVVGLRMCGSNVSGKTKITKFDNASCDYVFALTSEGVKYLIPAAEISCKYNVSLGSKYDQYKII